MSEVNSKLFEDFRTYLISNNYEIDVIDKESVRGIKGQKKFYFFYDYKYYQYCMYIEVDGFKKWATVFLENEDKSFRLNHHDDTRNFSSLANLISFTESSSGY